MMPRERFCTDWSKTTSANSLDNTIALWTRLGVLFGSRPARTTPDMEHLLLDTARLAPSNARLFYLAVTWVSQYGNFVARHRLKHLVEEKLSPEDHPVLGLLLKLAAKHGASRELLIAADVCRKAQKPQPLFGVHCDSPELKRIARNHACREGLAWNLWVPDQLPKLDALRPARWVIQKNPTYLDRIVRKGDLRCSILLTLQHDVPNGRVESETALARLCSANRIAVRHALDDLEREGCALRKKVPQRRRTAIVLGKSVNPVRVERA